MILAVLGQWFLLRHHPGKAWAGLMLICAGCLVREAGRYLAEEKPENPENVLNAVWIASFLVLMIGPPIAMTYQERLMKMENPSVPTSLHILFLSLVSLGTTVLFASIGHDWIDLASLGGRRDWKAMLLISPLVSPNVVLQAVILAIIWVIRSYIFRNLSSMAAEVMGVVSMILLAPASYAKFYGDGYEAPLILLE